MWRSVSFFIQMLPWLLHVYSPLNWTEDNLFNLYLFDIIIAPDLCWTVLKRQCFCYGLQNCITLCKQQLTCLEAGCYNCNVIEGHISIGALFPGSCYLNMEPGVKHIPVAYLKTAVVLRSSNMSTKTDCLENRSKLEKDFKFFRWRQHFPLSHHQYVRIAKSSAWL